MSESGSGAAEQVSSEAAQTIPYADPTTPKAGQVRYAAGMTRLDWAALTARVIGIYIMVTGLPMLVAMIPYFAGPFDSGLIVYSLLAFAFEGVGVMMLLYSSKVGYWLLPKIDTTEHIGASPGSPLDFQAVAFSVVGIVLIVRSLPQLAYLVWQYTLESIWSRAHDPGSSLALNVFIPAIELGLGIWLFRGAKGLSRRWEKMRNNLNRMNDDESGPL